MPPAVDSIQRPTAEQVEQFQRDGFVILPEFAPADEVERLRARFTPLFDHDWATGIAPDEVNFTPGVTPADRTRQLCNAWKSDPVVAATVLSARNAAFAAGLTGAASLRINQDNVIWKPPGGRPLLAHQDGSYLAYLNPPNMVTCWIALDETAADTGTIVYLKGSHRWPRAPIGGQFHAPDDWLAHAEGCRPPDAPLELVAVEVPPGGAAFHDAWVFHGSPANERSDAERRAVISHLIDGATTFDPSHPHSIYSRYRRPGEVEMDEAFFPIVWSASGYRSPWLADYLSGAVPA